MTHDTTTLNAGEIRTRLQVPQQPREAAEAPAGGAGRNPVSPSSGDARPEVTNHLRVLRSDQAWSQAELARRLGVSRQTVNALERGKYHPSLPLAFKIARLFDRPIEDVFHPQWEQESVSREP
jgi:putative transcriptional regulator